MKRHVRLGINIDHVATLRNARGEDYPKVTEAARIVEKSGADLVTVHVREDRRHINEKDLENILKIINIPLNLEIAATTEMQTICLNVKPYACCIVPEKRKELTSEGGLDVKNQMKKLDDTNIEKFDILIADVEGKEYEMLLGGNNKILKYEPIILIEIWGNKKRQLENMNTSCEEIINHMLNLKYKIVSRFDDNYVFFPEKLKVD